MSGKKIILAVLLFVLLFVSVTAGVVWSMTHYVILDMKFYPRDAVSLDLRQEALSIRQYERLKKELPGCDIHWNVPLGDQNIPEDSIHIAAADLKETDLAAFSYLKKLE